jgi:hypothetical protein
MAATRSRPRWRFGARAVGAVAVGAAAAAGAAALARFVAICEGILYYLFCEGTLT